MLIYKFMEDKSGRVLSEALGEGLEPYLGLHYPPSDIPEPARRLCSLTWVRHQPDTAYTPVPILPETNPLTGKPLDLSYALLRSVSITYVDYLKNLGTRSSLVLTLLKDGKLWGLVDCHHHSGPKYVPYEMRAACQFLAQMLSLLMSAKEDAENHQYRMKLKSTQLLMVENISRRGDFISGFIRELPNLLDLIKAEGAAAIVNGQIRTIGQTPSETEIGHIAQWLSNFMAEHVFATDCLSAYIPEALSFRKRCAGLLALRFSDTRNNFIFWFRPETIHTVPWAGDPRKPVDLSSDGQRLLPRTLFALWKETVQLKSSPWAEAELETVKELRAALLDLVLRRAEALETTNRELEADLKNVSEKKVALERLVWLIDSSDDAIITKTLDGTISTWNRGAEKVFGYSAAEIVGKSIRVLLPPERINEESDILARIRSGEDIKHFETLRVRKDGKIIDVSVTASPIRDSKGAIIGASKIARNIDEHKRAEEARERYAAALQIAHNELELRVNERTRELAASNRILEQSKIELQQFAYMASHDLQSPLRSISGFVQLLKMKYEGKLDDQAGDWIRRTVQAVGQIQALIKDLLAYSRVDSRIRPFVPTSFLDVFHDAVGLLESSISDAGAKVTCGDVPAIIGDRLQLVQLMDNLIGNALKYHGDKAPRVHLSAERNGNEWAFSVRDNGVGIAPEHYERIFEIFQRLHDQKEYPGTGIGLAVCRRIVNGHGGRIWVDSEPEQGSTFHFTLPAVPDTPIGQQIEQ